MSAPRVMGACLGRWTLHPFMFAPCEEKQHQLLHPRRTALRVCRYDNIPSGGSAIPEPTQLELLAQISCRGHIIGEWGHECAALVTLEPPSFAGGLENEIPLLRVTTWP